MGLEENKKIVVEFFEKLTMGNIQEAFSLVNEDVKWWIAGDLPFSGTKTKTEYMQIIEMIQSVFPSGFEIIAKQLTAETDKVAVEVESYGEHVSGKTYRNKYHFLIKLKGGKFIEVKEYLDTLHLYQLIQNQ